MRERKKDGRSDDSDNHGSPKPVLKHALYESTINQLLAKGYCSDQCEKSQALDVILRKKLQRELGKNSLDFRRLRDQAPQTHHLIQQNERGENDGDGGPERRIGYSQAELARVNFMRVAAPQNHSGGNPLKRESGRVERDAIHFCSAGHAHQLANATTPEHRHGDTEKKQNESEVPMHGGK